MSRLGEIFDDERLVVKIKERLPLLFGIAELESSRGGKIGMEVGFLRERIIVALLIYKFGEENVVTDIPTTEPEVDCLLFKEPISVKTITGQGGIKLSWTVDAASAGIFLEAYQPKYDMLLTVIKWDGEGGVYYVPLSSQMAVFEELSAVRYLKAPKPGTNPRGMELSKDARARLESHKSTRSLRFRWVKTALDYNPYRRWIEYWAEA